MLAVALLIGALARVAYLCEVARSPLFEIPALDAGFHHAWAVAWSTGNWADTFGQRIADIPSQAYFRPPGYALFLSACYRVFGTGGWAPRLFQALFGLGCVGAVYAIGRRVAPLAGACAALLLALYWPAVFYEAQLLDTVWSWTLCVLLLCALLRWSETRRPFWLAAAGLLMGVCAVFRPNILLFAPLAAAWTAWTVWRDSVGILAVMRAVLLLTVATCLPILPVTVRNALVAREFVLVSSNGGINFYIGNNPAASGIFSGDLGELGSYKRTDDNVLLTRGLTGLQGESVTDSAAGRMLLRQSLAFVRANPGQWLRLMARKFGFFWGAPEIRLNAEPAAERAMSRVLRLLPLSFPLLAALGLAGLVLASATRLPADPIDPTDPTDPTDPSDLSSALPHFSISLLFLLLAAWTLAVILFFVAGQYRQAVVPLLAVGGGIWIHALVRALSARRWRVAAAALLLLATAALLTGRNWGCYQANRVFALYSRAHALELVGRRADADRACLEIIQWPVQIQLRGGLPLTSSEHSVVAKAANALAVRHFRDNQWERAAELYELALAHAPDADTMSNRGVCLMAMGHLGAAEAAFAGSLAEQPLADHTRLYYAEALHRNGKRAQAVAELRRVAATPGEFGQQARALLEKIKE